MTVTALTIAGSDPSGGAGLQADLKTFHQHGVYGLSVVTMVTVQNTRAVTAVEVLDATLVAAQLEAVLSDIRPQAAKTGALGLAAVMRVVAEQAAHFDFPLVVDPVMISKHGDALIDDEAAETMSTTLLPRAFLVTPNMHEAAALAEQDVVDLPSMVRAARTIARLGPRNVLVKGGRLADRAMDVLYADGRIEYLDAERLDNRNTHGTGCVLSAAITARLARGETLFEAVVGAKRFITAAIRTSPGLGHGIGPVNMHIDPAAV